MKQVSLLLVLMFFIALLVNSCSKSSDSAPPGDDCITNPVTITGTITNTSTPTSSDGSLTVTATGGSGFTFNINGGSYQSSGNFTNLAAGTYTIGARNSNGCTASRQFTISSTATCSGVNISVSAASAPSTPCGTPNGTITVTATGSTGFTFSLNGGTYQSSGSFNNVPVGNHQVVARDANGCTGNTNVNVAATAAGPLFTAVKQLMQTNCVSCHNASLSEGGMNWTVDCNIVTNAARIKARAVDGNPSIMPPTGALPDSEKNKIIAWINAGGGYGN